MKENKTRSNARKKTVRNKDLKLKESKKLYDAIPLIQILQLKPRNQRERREEKRVILFREIEETEKGIKVGFLIEIKEGVNDDVVSTRLGCKSVVNVKVGMVW